MPNIPKDQTARVHVDPEISQDLSNATKLRDVLRTELRQVQDKKPDIAKHQTGGSA